ncbi:MAG: hypothetical protein KAH56_05405 [Candidatus Krumholzibacteria bacterium]|nr:hypothetical protein [Candidatus Krumholzibacteria bacterium]
MMSVSPHGSTGPRVSWSLIPVFAMLLVIWSGSRPAAAQTPFAIGNIGQRTTLEDARMVGRGGWGMAVTDSLNPGFKNLASLYSLRHLVLKFTGYGDNVESQDTRGERMNSRVFVPDVRVAGPVIKERLALTAGLVVHRSTQYHTLIDTTWTASVWGDSVIGSEQFERIGNRFRVPVGGALKILPGLAVSGSVNIEAGSLKGTVNNFFNNPGYSANNPFYQTNVKETKDEFHGTSQTWGVLLNPSSWFQVGASWTPAHKIEADRKVTHFGVSHRNSSSYTMEMPAEYMAGVQLRPFGRFRLGGDAHFQEFSKFTGPDEWMADMEDEFSLSFGMERMQGRIRRGGFSNAPLRVGASFKRWAYRVGGNVVDEKTISVGTGFPFRQNLGELDLAFSYSLIGDLEKNGVESTVWRLTLSVTGLERWW